MTFRKINVKLNKSKPIIKLFIVSVNLPLPIGGTLLYLLDTSHKQANYGKSVRASQLKRDLPVGHLQMNRDRGRNSTLQMNTENENRSSFWQD